MRGKNRPRVHDRLLTKQHPLSTSPRDADQRPTNFAVTQADVGKNRPRSRGRWIGGSGSLHSRRSGGLVEALEDDRISGTRAPEGSLGLYEIWSTAPARECPEHL